jgi:hypothetical protein
MAVEAFNHIMAVFATLWLKVQVQARATLKLSGIYAESIDKYLRW